MLHEALFYGSIFGWMFFTGIGIPPVPEEISIVGWAVATNTQDKHWWIAWPVVIAGIVVADIVLYAIGRFWGRKLFNYQWVNRLMPPARREKIEEGFHNHGVKILLTGRLLPPVRTATFITAGALHYSFARFLIADAIYAIPGVGFFFFFAYFAAGTVMRLVDGIHQAQYWVFIALFVVGGGYGLYRYIRFLRERSATNDLEPPHLPDIIHHHSHRSHAQKPKVPVEAGEGEDK